MIVDITVGAAVEALDRDVPLGELGKTSGPAPSSKFVRSVRRNGVIVPVLLREVARDDGTVEYRIIDGNRRIAAARKARRRSVPARILIGVSADEAARMTLAVNSFRSGNLVTELWAVRQLERSGVPQQSIVRESGLTSANFQVCDRLSRLDRRIFVGFAEGEISTTAALTVSRMSEEDQREIADFFESQGKLLVKDLRAFSKRGNIVRELVQMSPKSAQPHIQPAERDVASGHDTAAVISGEETIGEVPFAPVPEPSDLEHESDITPAPPIVANLQPVGAGGGKLSGTEVHVPEPAPVAPERPQPGTPPQTLTIVRRYPVSIPPPAPAIPATGTLPDDLRVAIGSIARRAIQLDIPERELTRVIQEVYRERSATQRRGQRSDVGERYA